MSGKDISLVLACYNEKPVFAESVPKIRKVLDAMRIDYEIIFVDDKSSDGSQNLIRAEMRKNPRAKAVFHEKNLGRGGSVGDGIKKSSGKIVGYLDIDLEISPNYIPEMYFSVLDGFEVVCAKRSYDVSLKYFFRDVMHGLYLRFAKLFLGIPVSDPNAGCKFFDRRKILPVLEETVDTHWFWDTEILKRSQAAGLKIKEIPVLYLHNPNKKSSVKKFQDSVHFISKVFWLRKKLREEEKGLGK